MHRPPQRPGASRQDYGTPRDFLDAVEARFGRIGVDLAATAENAVAGSYYGPDEDSLAQDWTSLFGTLWINPPFGRVAPWAAKCAASVGPGRRILLLTPAAIGTRWFAESVYGHALVLALRPRLTFVGARDPYPADLMMSVYDPALGVGFAPWNWRDR